MDKDFKVIVIAWLTILTLIWVAIFFRWQLICDRVARTILEGLVGEVTREVTYHRPVPPMQDRRRTELEDAVAREGGRAPGETLDEALARIERESLEADEWWLKDLDVDE